MGSILPQDGGPARAALTLALGFAHEYGQIPTVAFLLGTFAEVARPAFAAMMIDVRSATGPG